MVRYQHQLSWLARNENTIPGNPGSSPEQALEPRAEPLLEKKVAQACPGFGPEQAGAKVLNEYEKLQSKMYTSVGSTASLEKLSLYRPYSREKYAYIHHPGAE